MDQILIIYWSGTGNTAAMAGMVAEGVKEAGKEPVLLPVEEASVSELASCQSAALGCPSMGDEILEEGTMEPFVEEAEKVVSGKTVGLFGSYGWGDGQWMRDWEERMKAAGAEIVGGEGVICMEAPDDEAIAACEKLGSQLV